jgi:hypothetical protein
MARLATSLVTLRAEVNTFAPNRSKASDGWISDAAHAARTSRHNPNRFDVVTALDLTHHPAGGFDAHKWARLHVASGAHPQLAYIISNGQVASKSNGWRWVKYTGSSPHTAHIHVAVGVGPDSRPEPPYDSTASWRVAATVNPKEVAELNQQERDILNGIDARLKKVEEDVANLNRVPSMLSARNALDSGNTPEFTRITADINKRWPWCKLGLLPGWKPKS